MKNLRYFFFVFLLSCGYLDVEAQWNPVYSKVENPQSRPVVASNSKLKFVFRFADPERRYQSVKIKGTFNNWNASAFELKKSELNPAVGVNSATASGAVGGKPTNEWRGTWDLGRGIHQYVLVVDGKEMRDPQNPDSVSNGMGGFNSVIRNVVEDVKIQTLYYESQRVDTQKGKIIISRNGKNVSSWPIKKVLEVSQLNKVVCEIEYSSPESLKSYAEFRGRVQNSYVLTGSALSEFIKKNKDIRFQWSSAATNRHALLVVELDRFNMFGVLDTSEFLTATGDLTAFVYNDKTKSDDVLVPIKDGNIEKNTTDHYNLKDPKTMVIYNPMIDRFYDGNPLNNPKVKLDSVLERADYHGGDIKGLSQKIEEGYFKKLGINTIWISPVVLNPSDAWGQWNKPRTKFSGYHGYWPISSTQTDPRFCTEDELREFIDLAHKNNIRVLMDYVAHHVHLNHPLYQKHPDWFTSLYLPDGSKNTEKWDEHRLTTWFDDFLPTFDFSKPEVVDAMSDSALFWLRNYDIDGFRHDATKHIPNEFWLALTEKVMKENAKNGRSIYQIGETYGSPELIASYVGPQLLDAQFDFNLYDAAVAAFKSDKGNFTPLAETLLESKRWYGSHHSMGNITGNQDRPRFISLADGSIAENDNTKQLGWDKDIQVTTVEAYKKLQNLTAFMNFIPGVPVIYYGDEIGMPGANDPDSRRDMRFENQVQGKSGLTSQETQNKKIISGLIKMRTSSMALTFGDCVVEESSNNTMIIKRKYFDEEWFFMALNGSEAEINQKLARFGVSIFLIGEQGTGSQNLFTSQDLEVKKLKNNTNSIEYINMLKSGNCTLIIKAKKQ